VKIGTTNLKRLLCHYLSMLDTDVDHIRVDYLREYINDRKEEAKQRQVEAGEESDRYQSSCSMGEIKAFNEVLEYIEAKTDSDDGTSLDKIRD
jgi:hypothetical protein